MADVDEGCQLSRRRIIIIIGRTSGTKRDVRQTGGEVSVSACVCGLLGRSRWMNGLHVPKAVWCEYEVWMDKTTRRLEEIKEKPQKLVGLSSLQCHRGMGIRVPNNWQIHTEARWTYTTTKQIREMAPELPLREGREQTLAELTIVAQIRSDGSPHIYYNST